MQYAPPILSFHISHFTFHTVLAYRARSIQVMPFQISSNGHLSFFVVFALVVPPSTRDGAGETGKALGEMGLLVNAAFLYPTFRPGTLSTFIIPTFRALPGTWRKPVTGGGGVGNGDGAADAAAGFSTEAVVRTDRTLPGPPRVI